MNNIPFKTVVRLSTYSLPRLRAVLRARTPQTPCQCSKSNLVVRQLTIRAYSPSLAAASIASTASIEAMPKPAGGAPFESLRGRMDTGLLQGIKDMHLTNMTPVQEKILSESDWHQDYLVQSKTGTGKTIAFLLPALHNLVADKTLDRSKVGLLILAPTRELAEQIQDECSKLIAKVLPKIYCHLVVGGKKKTSQLRRFMESPAPAVIVATPGRLDDCLQEDEVRRKFSRLRCLVLDEADRMLDAGFAPDIRRILTRLPPKSTAKWQGMCFSATLPPDVKDLVSIVLEAEHVTISTIDPNEAPTIETVPQMVIPVPSLEDVLPTLHSFLSCARVDANGQLKAIIFCSTARYAGLLYHVFGHTGGAAPPKLGVWQMHSRMSQAARTKTIEEFKEAKSGWLFASDVVGRGIDIPDVNLVVQVGLPSDADQYVHRVGRTGRAGKTGKAVMILPPEEMWFVKQNPQFPIQNNGPFTHPKVATWPSAQIISTALSKIPTQVKEQTYLAMLGWIKTFMRRYGFDGPKLVDYTTRFAFSIGCDSIPEIPGRVIQQANLKPFMSLFKKYRERFRDGRKPGAEDPAEQKALREPTKPSSEKPKKAEGDSERDKEGGKMKGQDGNRKNKNKKKAKTKEIKKRPSEQVGGPAPKKPKV